MRFFPKRFKNRWRQLTDLMFRIRVYPGIRIPCPPDLYSCTMQKEGELSQVYCCSMNTAHPHAHWLLFDCEGAWAIGMYRPRNRRKMYLAFSRRADAMIFRLMQD